MSPRRNARAGTRPAGHRGASGPTSGKRRALGQHFLRDEAAAARIVALVSPTARDLVVEIGPGEGALTLHLARTAGRLVAVEVDAELAARLTARFAGAGAEILRADALAFDWAGLPSRRPDPEGRILIVGNLPYSVGKPILMALAGAAPTLAAAAPTELALMLQKEVAERVAAEPGGRTYGSLSVLSQLVFEVRLAFTVPPGAFRPPPLVDSAVLHLRARTAPPVPVADSRRLRAVVRAAFAQRRKSLANALAGGLGLPAERARVVLADLGIDPTRRAETLSLAEFARLAAALETA
ncbi:MAG TPA: 16S rRNA (adenine(1518)-N(6)/adenine(1519)-N(6))-dimethyltransferase RsmA [Candidatus Nitrosocosmicus sp.]|jgi:16S rRNA (adenine1518-N6/adenine1519-N6)-dimethyltransferase|nr:16S rRNA (adenine(1518)-N(6)/adenine(1519)-N(6))-dimethyltransferase RsmA [Candidatus Nitrosocosmicus sp.]